MIAKSPRHSASPRGLQLFVRGSGLSWRTIERFQIGILSLKRGLPILKNRPQGTPTHSLIRRQSGFTSGRVRKMRIGTRSSAMALAQTDDIAAAYRAAHPDATVEIVRFSPRGDIDQVPNWTPMAARAALLLPKSATLCARAVSMRPCIRLRTCRVMKKRRGW